MEFLINNAISEILEQRKELLKIAVRRKSKFEGWLKFELAHYLEKSGFEAVEVETTVDRKRDRADISFFHNDDFYRVELKTANTNWNIEGVQKSSKPITKNIESVIVDAKKLNSNQGIVAFVLFPIPMNDHRWTSYIERISKECEIKIDIKKQCRLIKINIDSIGECNFLVCSFRSRRFSSF